MGSFRDRGGHLNKPKRDVVGTKTETDRLGAAESLRYNSTKAPEAGSLEAQVSAIAARSDKAAESKRRSDDAAGQPELAVAIAGSDRGVRLTVRFEGYERLSARPAHADPETGWRLLGESLGSGDPDFLRGLLKALPLTSWGPGIAAEELNFLLSVIQDIKPATRSRPCWPRRWPSPT